MTAFFLTCVCGVAASSPQAHTCGFNPGCVDRLLHSICISLQNLSLLFLVSSSVPPALPSLPALLLCLCFLSQSIFPFLPFLISPANVFSARPHLFLTKSFSSLLFPFVSLETHQLVIHSLKYFPAGASQPCHSRMHYSPLTSHRFERVMPKTSLSSRDACESGFKSCIVNHKGSQTHTVCFSTVHWASKKSQSVEKIFALRCTQRQSVCVGK